MVMNKFVFLSVQDQDKKLQDLWRTCQKLPPQNFVNFRYVWLAFCKLSHQATAKNGLIHIRGRLIQACLAHQKNALESNSGLLGRGFGVYYCDAPEAHWLCLALIGKLPDHFIVAAIGEKNSCGKVDWQYVGFGV